MPGQPIRIQSQVPAEGRTWTQLLSNIAGNVVSGKVHPALIVAGVPVAATSVPGAIALTAKYPGTIWNGYRIFKQENSEGLCSAYLFNNTGPNEPTGMVIVLNYQPEVHTYGQIQDAITEGTPFTATNVGLPGKGSGDTTPDGPNVAILGTIATAGGKDLECFPQAPKDYVRIIQNCGTNAVKLLYSNSGQASAAQFHQILTACSAQDDGTGGNVRVICSDKVTAIGADGNAVRLAITRIESPEAI